MPDDLERAPRLARASAATRQTGWRAVILAAVTLTALAVLAGCGAGRTSIVAPQGPRAASIVNLWWVMLGLAVVIYAIVVIFLLIALFRPRRDDGGENGGPPGGRFFVPVAGIVIPTIILVGLFGLTVWTMGVQDAPAEPADLTIEVVGNQWWWEARYPDHDVVTANEIHIPAGEPVRVLLTSNGVIHSFWVPRLAGKMDLIPGEVNEFWIEADEPGVFYGECAEFCGIQHALMAFHVVAEPPLEFDTWIEEQQQPAEEPLPDTLVARGQDVFLNAGCIQCHTVKGTQATGQLGPDLTHLSSRRAIAAGTLQNTLGNLTAWVVDPQAIKPGAKMPKTELDSEDLQALVAFLRSLD